MIGIYKITSPTGKINIGQSWNIKKRKNSYKYLECKKQTKIYNSLKKYGFENHLFEVIHELPIDITQEILDNYEIFYWQQYKDCGFEMMNIRDPGKGGKLSEETKRKISEVKKASLKGITSKVCKKCEIEKDLNCFYKEKHGKFGIGSICKSCKKEYNIQNIEKIYKQHKEYYINNKEEHKKRMKKWRLENPDKAKEIIQCYEENNKEKVKNYRKQYKLKYIKL